MGLTLAFHEINIAPKIKKRLVFVDIFYETSTINPNIIVATQTIKIITSAPQPPAMMSAMFSFKIAMVAFHSFKRLPLNAALFRAYVERATLNSMMIYFPSHNHQFL